MNRICCTQSSERYVAWGPRDRSSESRRDPSVPPELQSVRHRESDEIAGPGRLCRGPQAGLRTEDLLLIVGDESEPDIRPLSAGHLPQGQQQPMAQILSWMTCGCLTRLPVAVSQILLLMASPDGPETPTISPSNPRYSSGANLSLSCHADSNPPAQYSWLINGRPQEPTQELFIPHITVNDSGSYTCLVHNSVTGLNRTTVKSITVSDDSTAESVGLSDGAIVGIVIGVLVGVALIAALAYFLYSRKTGGASDQRDHTEHKPSASNHSQRHFDNSPNQMEEVAYSSLNFSAQEPKRPTSASLSPAATETVYSEVKKK
ncbi:carcinoembryonic antigen-related cell adhesion molecule 1 [Pteropus alecto]|uniref:carcinoembryonic antigen-related cell adhesion molecule 1 n=1 Tax=Pteropus alecto TaxID=9402 RepID=UPI0003F17A09|nr:carcinoembryonic antigen-related cell adhesion molecule 1 [Pteropus alecto]